MQIIAARCNYPARRAMIAPPLPPLTPDSVQVALKLPVAELTRYAARPCTLVEEGKSFKLLNGPAVSDELTLAGKLIAPITTSVA